MVAVLNGLNPWQACCCCCMNKFAHAIAGFIRYSNVTDLQQCDMQQPERFRMCATHSINGGKEVQGLLTCARDLMTKKVL